MKKLYLLRHAKSSWDFADLNDHDRPLNQRGRNDAPLMGKELLSRELEPDLIMASSAVRALTTATLVAKALEYNPDQITVNEGIYGADKDELFQIIRQTPDDVAQLLLVGHNPTITEVTNFLSPEHVADMPTAGVVGLSFNCATWGEIDPANATFLFFDFPKNHQQLS